jgi:prepilin-type N-terminal cleavage/methylation domain-containing protein
MMKRLKKGRNMKKSDSRGFTIVELAIVMIIFGLFASIILYALQTYYRNAERKVTKDSLVYSQIAIMEFRALKGRYPCPADPNLSPGDVGYGTENCDAATSGVKEVFGRDADNADNDNDETTGGDSILVGAIPFATMLDPDGDVATVDGVSQTPFTETRTIDGWDNKLTYAITTNLTNPSSYGDSLGAIDIVDEFDETLLSKAGTAHMVLISHGEQAKGALSREGQPVDSCAPVIIVPPPPNPPPFAVSELENCDNDGKFVSGLRVEDKQSYNDDYVQFLMTRLTAFWVYTGVDTTSGALLVANTNSGRVGVGLNDPQEQLEVDGDIDATKAMAIEFCDEDGYNAAGDVCMPTSTIAGDEPAMRCPTFNKAVQVVEDNGVVCNDDVFNVNTLGSCPSPQVVIGISSVSGVICGILPN